MKSVLHDYFMLWCEASTESAKQTLGSEIVTLFDNMYTNMHIFSKEALKNSLCPT